MIFFLFMSLLFHPLHSEETYSLAPETKKMYEEGIETYRLEQKWGRLEKLRVEQLLNQLLPNPPATIADIGGGTGVYAFPLAKKGYALYLIDPVAFHIEEAKRKVSLQKETPLQEYIIADARQVPLADNSVDVVLLFGPLYHLNKEDRQIALNEAYRILKPNGIILAQTISKYALMFEVFFDEKINQGKEISQQIESCLDDGCFTYNGGSFYAQTPEELRNEVEQAKFQNVRLLAIEGFSRWLPSKEWDNEYVRKKMLHFIQKTEEDPSILGISDHIMAVGQK